MVPRTLSTAMREENKIWLHLIAAGGRRAPMVAMAARSNEGRCDAMPCDAMSVLFARGWMPTEETGSRLPRSRLAPHRAPPCLHHPRLAVHAVAAGVRCRKSGDQGGQRGRSLDLDAHFPSSQMAEDCVSDRHTSLCSSTLSSGRPVRGFNASSSPEFLRGLLFARSPTVSGYFPSLASPSGSVHH